MLFLCIFGVSPLEPGNRRSPQWITTPQGNSPTETSFSLRLSVAPITETDPERRFTT